MKSLLDYILENEGDPITDEVIDNELPVKTKDGNQAIIVDIDRKQVPNILIGKVKYKDKLVDYEWDDTGKCIKASDQYGNPKKVTDNDNLVQV